MAIISIYIPDSGANRVFDAIAANYRYNENIGNPIGGQDIIFWSSGVEFNNELLPIAIGQGYNGLLPGTVEDRIFYSENVEELLSVASGVGYTGETIPDPIIPPFVSSTGVKTGEFIYTVVRPFVGTYPVTSPFIEGSGSGGMLGVVTGVHPATIPNPQTKAEFTNGIIRGFLGEHVKVYELDLARKQAEQAAGQAGNVIVDDASTATVYDYHMVCLEPAKAQYDALASVIAPGNSFNIALSVNGENPATHYGLQAGITDTARQQLLVLELAGGTSTGGVQTMFYVRCDPQTHIAQSTNISGFDIVGQPCSFSGLLNHLGLKEIG
jgi:hypothetical protein